MSEVISMPIDFNKVYKTYYNEVVSFCTFKLQNEILAEEVVNDSFLKLYNNLSAYNPEKASIKTWLFTIINNTIIDYYRQNKKEQNKSSIDNISNNTNVDSKKRVFELHDNNVNGNGFNIMCNNDIKTSVVKSINKLPSENLRNVAKLYFIEDLSYNEISEALNISLSNVKVLIHRIRIDLQNSLRKKEVYI
jgi:RNA polymerase sigma-70 factor, ECF subfamily